MRGQIGDEDDIVVDEVVDEGPSGMKESEIGLTTFMWPTTPRSEWPIHASATEIKLQLKGFQSALQQYLHKRHSNSAVNEDFLVYAFHSVKIMYPSWLPHEIGVAADSHITPRRPAEYIDPSASLMAAARINANDFR